MARWLIRIKVVRNPDRPGEDSTDKQPAAAMKRHWEMSQTPAMAGKAWGYSVNSLYLLT